MGAWVAHPAFPGLSPNPSPSPFLGLYSCGVWRRLGWDVPPPFSSASLSSLAVALGVQDADLTKEPQRDDQSELKLCYFKQGLFLVLANAFFPFYLICLLTLVPCSPQAGYLVSPLGLGYRDTALRPGAGREPGCGLGAKTWPSWALSLRPPPRLPEALLYLGTLLPFHWAPCAPHTPPLPQLTSGFGGRAAQGCLDHLSGCARAEPDLCLSWRVAVGAGTTRLCVAVGRPDSRLLDS